MRDDTSRGSSVPFPCCLVQLAQFSFWCSKRVLSGAYLNQSCGRYRHEFTLGNEPCCLPIVRIVTRILFLLVVLLVIPPILVIFFLVVHRLQSVVLLILTKA